MALNYNVKVLGNGLVGVYYEEQYVGCVVLRQDPRGKPVYYGYPGNTSLTVAKESNLTCCARKVATIYKNSGRMRGGLYGPKGEEVAKKNFLP